MYQIMFMQQQFQVLGNILFEYLQEESIIIKLVSKNLDFV